MIGDGLTDLAAHAAGAYVVGYGVVAHREVMRQKADCYVAAPSLNATLPALLTEEELARSQAFRSRSGNQATGSDLDRFLRLADVLDGEARHEAQLIDSRK